MCSTRTRRTYATLRRAVQERPSAYRRDMSGDPRTIDVIFTEYSQWISFQGSLAALPHAGRQGEQLFRSNTHAVAHGQAGVGFRG